MRQKRVLDLFCCAGGAGMGYARAGFEVVGVDINPQRNYPFEFHRADALEYPLDGFDVIHASPPCQHYSVLNKAAGTTQNHPDLIGATRERIKDHLYVIENVAGAPLSCPFILCGSMFNLRTADDKMELRRHRFFECSIMMLAPECRHTDRLTIGVYGHGTQKYLVEKLGRCTRIHEKREAMGIDWTNRDELSQAIPPAYTEWIGERLMEYLRSGGL